MTAVGLHDMDANEIAQLIADVLDIDKVAPEETLFALGGDSLQAVRLAQRLSRRLGRRIPPGVVLSHPSALQLAGQLALIAGAEPAAAPEPESSPPADADLAGLSPLSAAQRRVWILHEMRPDRADHVIRASAAIRGQVDARRFIATWVEVAARHHALRTRFVRRDRDILSTVDAVPARLVQYLDLVPVRDEARTALLRERIDRIRGPMNPETGPLTRILLARIAPQSYQLEMAIHHLVCDGWSTSILARDFLSLYIRKPLPAVTSYADYVQRESRDAAAQHSAIEMLRDRLLPLPDELRFAEETRSASPDPAAGEIDLEASRPISDAFIRALSASRYTALTFGLAALGILIARLTGQEDFLVAVPLAGRTEPEHDDVVGLFVNTGIARVAIRGAANLADVLDYLQREVGILLDHQSVPFDALVNSVRSRRPDGTAPLARVAFAVQNYRRPPCPPAEAGFTWEFRELPEIESKFDLGFTLAPSADQLRLLVTYRSALFTPDTVQRWADQYLSALSHVLAATRDIIDTAC